MKSLIICATLCLAFVSVYGLECYVCEGGDSAVKEGDCGDDYEKPAAHKETCNSTAKYCMKQKTGANHIYTYVTRACADKCEERNIAYVDRVVCCDKDLCNHGNSIAISIASLVFVTIPVFLLN